MRVAPFRALTLLPALLDTRLFRGRNEGRPFQGIDTHLRMCGSLFLVRSRNEGRPFQGIDTIHTPDSPGIILVRRNEGRPFQGIDTRCLHNRWKHPSL